MIAIVLAIVIATLGMAFFAVQMALFIVEQRDAAIRRERRLARIATVDFSDSKAELEIKKLRREMQRKRVQRMHVAHRYDPSYA